MKVLPRENPLAATLRQQSGVMIIDLHGEINALCESVLQDAYNQATSQAPYAIALNFKDVDYINSTGIALIVSILAQARKSHIPILTFGLSDHYQEIFQITRLSDFMSIHQDEASALAEMAAEGKT
jgi:anti-anti-sigma factor